MTIIIKQEVTEIKKAEHRYFINLSNGYLIKKFLGSYEFYQLDIFHKDFPKQLPWNNSTTFSFVVASWDWNIDHPRNLGNTIPFAYRHIPLGKYSSLLNVGNFVTHIITRMIFAYFLLALPYILPDIRNDIFLDRWCSDLLRIFVDAKHIHLCLYRCE